MLNFYYLIIRFRVLQNSMLISRNIHYLFIPPCYLNYKTGKITGKDLTHPVLSRLHKDYTILKRYSFKVIFYHNLSHEKTQGF